MFALYILPGASCSPGSCTFVPSVNKPVFLIIDFHFLTRECRENGLTEIYFTLWELWLYQLGKIGSFPFEIWFLKICLFFHKISWV